MAVLKDSLITGDLRVTGTIYGNVPLNDLVDADDLKAIEALSGTSGWLKKTAANTWALGTFAASDIPNIDASKITSGTLPIARGGTGLTASPSMLTNLESTTAVNVLQASPRPGITGTLGITNGGTGATTAANAVNNLLSGAPAWTAAPTDSTYFIRQDTNGVNSFGRAPFSTVWIYIKGKADSVYATSGHNHDSTYVNVSGDTMTGVLKAYANQCTDDYTTCGINMQNSNIAGLNSIYTADASDNGGEGIHFYRDSTHVDTLWVNGGDILFAPNRALGTGTTKANSQKVGRFTANPTSGQVVITDGTTGGMKSSGYTIAASVPSGAKFTDTNYYHTTGSWNGLTYTATANGGAGALAFTIPTGTSATTVAVGNHTHDKSSITSVYEADLVWGGKNFNASYGCIDAAMVDVLGANRLMFAKAAGISIEYSRDNGTTWTDYGATNEQKVGLFSSGYNFIIGKADSTNKATANGTNYQLRITLDTGAAGVYTNLNKFIFNISTAGSNNCTVSIDKALQNTPTTYTNVASNIPISGWSGYNVVNVEGITTYGNTATSQYGRIRFTFKANGGNTSYIGLVVSQIMGYGGIGWITPSTMAKTGHLYSYDANQNATFPAKVTATTLAGNLDWSYIQNKPTLGTLSTKSSIANHSYTPAGTVSQPTFTGNALTSTGKFTPAGTNSAPAFTGTAATIVVSGGSGTATYTPAGTIAVNTAGSTVAADDITAWTTNTPTAVTKKTVVVSTSATTVSVSNEVLTIPASVLTGSTTGDSVSVTAGTAATLTYTARTVKSGDASYKFTGTGTRLTASYTPAGSVAAPTFTGTQGNLSVSGTPSGTVSKPTFSGTAATLSHTIS